MTRLLPALLVAAGLCAAQDRPLPGPGPSVPPSPVAPGPRSNAFPWWDSPLVQDLKLSDDQQAQIRNTVKDYRSKLIELRATLEKAEGDLNDVYDEEKVDPKRANDAIERVVAARSDLTRTFSQMSLKLRNVLTIDQWRELEKRRPLREWHGMREGSRRSTRQPSTTPPPKPPTP